MPRYPCPSLARPLLAIQGPSVRRSQRYYSAARHAIPGAFGGVGDTPSRARSVVGRSHTVRGAACFPSSTLSAWSGTPLLLARLPHVGRDLGRRGGKVPRRHGSAGRAGPAAPRIPPAWVVGRPDRPGTMPALSAVAQGAEQLRLVVSQARRSADLPAASALLRMHPYDLDSLGRSALATRPNGVGSP
jgi:hypothetical protein